MSDRLTLAVLRFTATVERLNDPADILEALHQFGRLAGLNAFGAWCLPAWARRDDRRAFSIHMHPSIPAAFISEYWKLYSQHGRSFLQTLAWQNRGAFTMTEALRLVKPTGDDRWVQELAYRHGIRDVFYCPNGGCMVVYWSPKPLRLDATTRAVLQLAAGATAARLRALSRRSARQEEPDPGLSPRQRAVLRLVSLGLSLHETADHLGIAYGTAQEHAERAAKKLGAKSLPHAVAEALRRYVVIGIGMSAACTAIFDVYDICCWDEIVRWVG
jgi:DNA-binding CsgD family transcriptional regulator